MLERPDFNLIYTSTLKHIMSTETTTNGFAYNLIAIVVSSLAVAISVITFFINHIWTKMLNQLFG